MQWEILFQLIQIIVLLFYFHVREMVRKLCGGMYHFMDWEFGCMMNEMIYLEMVTMGNKFDFQMMVLVIRWDANKVVIAWIRNEKPWLFCYLMHFFLNKERSPSKIKWTQRYNSDDMHKVTMNNNVQRPIKKSYYYG